MPSSIPSARQAWVLPELSKREGAKSLQLKDVPVPELGADGVLVKVKATSLNFRDLLVTTNLYPAADRAGFIPVSDGAGEVVAVGSNVTKWRPGDRVLGIFNRDHVKGSVATDEEKTGAGGVIDGWLASHVVYPSHGLVRLPEHLTFEEGATLPCAAVTAYNALVGLPSVQVGAGDAVIIEGTGGVSIFGLQIAVASGARVVITSSSDEKLAKVLTHIPTEAHDRVHTINYKQVPEWGAAAVEKLGSKAKVVVEVGGNKTLGEAYKAIAPGGVIASIGFVADLSAPAVITPMQAITTQSIFRGIFVGSRELFERLNLLLEANKVHPVVDRVFKFEESPQAFEYLHSQKHVGKVVIRVA